MIIAIKIFISLLWPFSNISQRSDPTDELMNTCGVIVSFHLFEFLFELFTISGGEEVATHSNKTQKGGGTSLQ